MEIKVEEPKIKGTLTGKGPASPKASKKMVAVLLAAAAAAGSFVAFVPVLMGRDAEKPPKGLGLVEVSPVGLESLPRVNSVVKDLDSSPPKSVSETGISASPDSSSVQGAAQSILDKSIPEEKNNIIKALLEVVKEDTNATKAVLKLKNTISETDTFLNQADEFIRSSLSQYQIAQLTTRLQLSKMKHSMTMRQV